MAWQRIRGLANLCAEQILVRGDQDDGKVYVTCTTTTALSLDLAAARHLADSLMKAADEAESMPIRKFAKGTIGG